MNRIKDYILLKLYLYKPLIGSTLLILSIIYFFFGIFYGLDYSDSFYHLNHAIQPPNDTHLYTFLLSSLLIKFFIELSGYELIIVRFINSLLFFFVIVCPFIFLKIRRPKVEVLFYISGILILMAPLNSNILGYDTLSKFILAIIFSVIILYLKKSNIYLVIIIAILSSVAILIRLPNILLIPIVILVFLGNEGLSLIKITRSGIKFAVLYFLLTILFLILSYYIYYGNWKVFIESTLVSPSHNFKTLISNYLRDGYKIIIFIAFLLTGYFFFKLFQKTKNKFLLYGVLIFFHCVFLYKFVLFTGYSWNYSLYLTSIALSIIGIHSYYNRKNRGDFSQLLLYVYLLFLFINPFGSDTGFLKMASLLLLFPFILSLIDLKLKKFWFILLITLLPMSILQKAFIIYEDNKIKDLDKILNLKLLHPIRTNEFRYNHLNNVDNLVKELQQNGIKVFFYGNNSHIFHYLYPNSSLSIKSFRQPVDTLLFLPDIEKALLEEDKTALFLVKSYPEQKLKEDISLLEEELLKIGFEIRKQNSLIYYLRNK